MFARLFAEAGLSLDRLRALVEVGAAGGIAKAADGDPVRQSQYSRQIKELEGFFQTKLVERQGKGVRLTARGRELARISRFFLLGLANFQRGCRLEEQTFRVGGGPTVMETFLVPALADLSGIGRGPRFVLESIADAEIERRLHDLTLDFGVVYASPLSRPLGLTELGSWRLCLWIPRGLYPREPLARRFFAERKLPLALALGEVPAVALGVDGTYESRWVCPSFLAARTALEGGKVAALLPEFLAPRQRREDFLRLRIPGATARRLTCQLAWNPRLLRLNPHAARQRDELVESFTTRMSASD